MKTILQLLCFAVAFILSGCASTVIPKDIQPVDHFEVGRYTGKWYEIARLDHRFERGLEQITADYHIENDGAVSVVNRGFDPIHQKWKESKGKAYFTGSSNIASLKVSFFGPFYGGYNVIKIDSSYQYALVTGHSKDYLWIIARTPTISHSVREEFVSFAKSQGFAVEKLIWVKQ